MVSLSPVGSEELIAVVLDAYALTDRQREVTQQVLRGSTTAQVAATLRVFGYTVQDHLKSIFRKVGVGSCRELVSAIFGRHYQPQLGPDQSPRLIKDGRLCG